MSATAIIGCDSPLGKYWASKRYVDCLVNEENDSLLRGRQFGHVVLVCPSLWVSPEEVKADLQTLNSRIIRLMGILGETKIEKLVYITGLDLFAEDGNEDNRIPVESETSYEGMLAGFSDYLNLQFGRVLNIRLPELVGMEGNAPGWSVLAELAKNKGKKTKLKVGLLTKHQFYPVERIVNDVEKGWECGLSEANLVSEPLTAFELTEQLTPDQVDNLPVAREKDPVGSARTSKYALHWNDNVAGYIMDKNETLEYLRPLV